jgi:ABC-type branched-subunit amino acid transport system substrate-binding protein
MVRYKGINNDRAVKPRSSHRRQHKEVIIDFEALFIPDSSKKISMLAPQLDYHDVNGVLLFGTNLWHSDQLIASAGDYVQEAVVPDIFFKGSMTQHVKRFVSNFQAQFGSSPDFMEAITYDTTRMVFQVLMHHELFSRDDVKIALKTMNPFNGITGPTVFDDTGEAQKNLYLLQIVGNQFVELERSGSVLSYLKK